MEIPIRNYKTKDVDMIIASDTIIDSAILKQPELVIKRANWTIDFFKDLKIQIDKATEQHLGVDSAKKLRQSTVLVKAIVSDALTYTSEAKVQIEEDFKYDPALQNEILTTLGFKSYFIPASKNKDQEAMIDLLFQFKTNLTPDLATQIVEKGTAQATLDKIVGFANQLKDADVTQEGFKMTKKEITAEGVNQFNAIYDKVISICRIVSRFYKENKAVADQFSFNKVVKGINNTKPKKTENK